MKSKNTNKNKCTTCKHYNGKDCTHELNCGLLIRYRQEAHFYIKTPPERNKDGKCKNYEKLEFSKS